MVTSLWNTCIVKQVYRSKPTEGISRSNLNLEVSFLPMYITSLVGKIKSDVTWHYDELVSYKTVVHSADITCIIKKPGFKSYQDSKACGRHPVPLCNSGTSWHQSRTTNIL
jgi:hypothetical protein